MRTDDMIVNSAKRLVEKLNKSKYCKLNGEYSKDVQLEIKRIKGYCFPAQKSG